MTQFARTKVVLGGFDGAPGVNVLNWCAPAHADIEQDDVDNFNETLYDSLTALSAGTFALGVTLTIDPVVSIHEVDTGELIGIYTDAGGPWSITGSGNGSESRATQAGLRWFTNDFRYGRRVQGRTFWGPSSSAGIGTDGKFTSAVQTAYGSAFSGIYDGLSSRLIIWSRPSPAHPVGGYADVVSAQLSPEPFVLRGRRGL